MSRALMCLVVVMILLTGCKESGSGSSSFPGGVGGSGFVGGDSGGGNSGGGNVPGTPVIPHNPEPATIALLGGGLAAYMLLKRKKK